MRTQRYEVAIIGGGIAGTTLANMCERLDIDYVLLEARPSLEADEGTGIAMQPNGFQILDQLGIAEKIIAETAGITDWHTYSGKGELMNSNSIFRRCEDILGYPTIFTSRRKLCHLLSDSITQRDRVRCSSKVTSITESDNQVVLTTSNGETYTADIVIGADGVNSFVRNFIDKTGPEKDAARSPDDYMSVGFSCCYGISSPTPGFVPGDRFTVMREESGTIGFTGEDGTIFWFIFEHCTDHMGKPKRFSERPRFSKADADAQIPPMADVRIMPNAKFGDIAANRTVYFRIPLEEGIAPSWHTPRTVIVGDAAHKMSPASGMGANVAIESCAVLMNNLMSAQRQCGTGSLSRDVLNTAWSRYSENRKKIGRLWMNRSHIITQSLLFVPGKPLAVGEKIRDMTDDELLGLVIDDLSTAPMMEGVEVTERGKVFFGTISAQRAKKQNLKHATRMRKQERSKLVGKL